MSSAELAVRDLRFTYGRDGEELFGGLDHDFASGVVNVVTGPSGCGKSTLLYLLGLMLRPGSGQVLVDGVHASGQTDALRSWIRATRIGFVFQDAVLDPSRTVIDSVIEPGLYGRACRRDLRSRGRELLDELGVGHRADHRPGEISGGQAQRVAVARALITDPGIILADEPTGNLDSENSIHVLDALHAAAATGRTVVIATHDPVVLARAGQILAL